LSDRTQRALAVRPERTAIAEYPVGAEIAPRIIEDYELVWMLHGAATFASGGRHWAMGTGDLLLVPPSVEHSFQWDQRRTSRHAYVHFRLHEGMAPAAPLMCRAGDQDPMAGLLRYLLWLSATSERWQPPSAQVIELLLALVTSGPLPPGNFTMHAGLATALEHVSHQWRQMPLRRLTISELAAAGAMSSTLLHRLFRTEFGVSPGVALEGARLLRARALLLDTSLPSEAVARACGFADAAHFAHRCRTVLGVTPRQLRGGAAMPVPEGVERLVATLWTGRSHRSQPATHPGSDGGLGHAADVHQDR